MASTIRTGGIPGSGGRGHIARARRLLPLLVLIVIGAITWQTGLLRHIDLRSQQLALHYLQTPSVESRQILLVSPDTGTVGDMNYARVLTEIAKLKPRLIITTQPPPKQAHAALQALNADGKVLVGLGLLSPTVAGLAMMPQSLPADQTHWSTAVLGHTRDVHGLHEGQFAYLATEDAVYPTPVTFLAELDDRTPYDFRINFINAWSRIPQVSWTRVVEGGLISELVEGRVVFVGHQQFLAASTVPSLAGSRTPRLLLDALAMDTWLEQTEARVISPPIVIATMLLTLILGLIAFQWMSYARTIWSTIWASVGFAVGAPLALVYLNFDIPGSLLIISITFAALTVLYSKLQTEDGEFRRVLLSASLTLQEKNAARVNDDANDLWAEAATLVDQIFGGQRFALVTLDPKAKRVKDINTFNCDAEDVIENREDVRRSPYADALAQRRPLEITASESYRPYLEQQDDERQLIVALRTTGALYGFLVAGVTKEFDKNHPDANDLLRSVSIRISELLRANQSSEIRSGSAADYFLLKGGRLLSRTVSQVGELVRTRLSRMENLFDQMATATIVYDLFGNVLYSNRRMTELTNDTELKPYELNAADFLAQITQIDVAESREKIRKLMLNEEAIQLPVKMTLGPPGTRLYVNIRTITDGKEDTTMASGTLEAAGLLFEIVDLGVTQNVEKSRAILTKHLDYELRTRFGSSMMAIQMLRGDEVAAEHREMLLDQVVNDIERATGLLDESQEFLHPQDEHNALVSVADPRDVVRDAHLSARATFPDRDVDIQIDMPTMAFLIKGDIAALTKSLSLMLQILVRDTADEGIVRITANQHAQEFEYLIQNEGYGLPASQLKAYLSGSDQNASIEFRKLRETLVDVSRSGTRIQANSTVAKGMAFRIVVPRVMINEPAA